MSPVVTLPYPPSVNRYWRMARGHMHLSNEGRQYKEIVAGLARKAGMKPMDGSVSIEVHVFRPRRSGDLDNTLKGLLDALRGCAYHDDSQIVKIEAHRGDDRDNPRVEVRVSKVV